MPINISHNRQRPEAISCLKKNRDTFLVVVTGMFCIIVLSLFSIMLAGCSQQEIMLIRLSESQSQMQQYIKQQEAFFAKLKEDIKNNRLKTGMSKSEVLSAYGQPILCDSANKTEQIKERCLYRHPTKYFFTDLIYLDFDKDSKLISWEIKPAKEDTVPNNKS